MVHNKSRQQRHKLKKQRALRHHSKGLVRQLRRARYRNRQPQKSKNHLYKTLNWLSWHKHLKVKLIRTRGQLKIRQIWVKHKRTKASKDKDHKSHRRQMLMRDRLRIQQLRPQRMERNNLRKRRKRRTKRKRRRKIKMMALIQVL